MNNIKQELLEKQFAAKYAKLNEKQKEAVDTIYGPIMVLAGPGTGKTEVLALRIAQLMRGVAQVQPQEILCITFTEAGRIAMRNRLVQIVGLDVAQQITVHTFHSFCNDVLQNNKQLFNKEILDPATEIQKYQVLETMQASLPPTHQFSNAKYRHTNAKQLLALFQTMKKENWSQEWLTAKIDQYLNDILPHLPAFKQKKDPTKYLATYQPEVEKNEKLKVAVSLYNNYLATMLEQEIYDFDDMILWVIKSFEENPELAKRYREQFQYMLVDEYQDTNGSQNKIIELLCQAEEGDPNLFVVGDDDQSIFRFQGANTESMSSVINQYPSTKIIALKINYRSTTEVVNSSLFLIKSNSQRLKYNEPDFESHIGQANIKPTISCLQNYRQEYIYITTEIQKLLQQGTEPKEIAVLYNKNDDCLAIAKYLQHIGIDTYTSKKQNLFKMPLSAGLINIMLYLAAELDTSFSGDGILFKILHLPYLNIPPLDIAKAAFRANEAARKKESINGSLRVYLSTWVQTVNPSLFADSPGQYISKAFNILEQALTTAATENIFILFRTLVKELGIHKYILQQPNKKELLDELTALFRFIEKAAISKGGCTLPQFMDLLTQMNELGIEESFYTTIGKDNGVQLLTIHASKGLEYEHVFVAGCTSANWEGKPRRGGGQYKIPFNVFENKVRAALENEEALKDIDSEETRQEQRRLIYVAATRAKKHLNFTWHRVDEKEKEMSPSNYMLDFTIWDKDKDSTVEELQYKPTTISIDTDTLLHFEPIDVLLNETKPLEIIEKEIINKRLENFVLNVSALNKYIDCPVKFYYTNILSVPEGTNAKASFGSAIHAALEYAYKTLITNNNTFLPLADIVKVYKIEMFKSRITFTTQEYERMLPYGEKVMEMLYQHELPKSNKIVKVEHRVDGINHKGIPLRGFADKLEFTGKNVSIVDYKTGKYDSDYAKKCRVTPMNAKGEIVRPGGDYWRQGAFYHLIVSLDKKYDYTPINAKFMYVEPKAGTIDFYEHTFVYTEKEIDLLKAQIEDSWQKIHNHEFTEGCKKEDCDWCNFVQENNL